MKTCSNVPRINTPDSANTNINIVQNLDVTNTDYIKRPNLE